MFLAYAIGGSLVFIFIFILIADIKRIFFKNNKSEKEYQYKSSNNMSTTAEKIIKMKNDWEELGIVSFFTKTHHFASEKFNSKPPTLYKHYNYCIDKNIHGENVQTLDRCLMVAKLCSDGLDVNNAITKSWAKYPVLKN